MDAFTRVGLVIHYSRTNYGNHLVNYAARSVLEQCDRTVDVIVVEGGERERKRAARRRLPMKVVRLIRTGALADRIGARARRATQPSTGRVDQQGPNSQRLTRFQEFSDVHLSPQFCDAGNRHELVPNYERFVIGSDQIWNYDYDLGPWHFLDFADPTSIVCLSPSVGHDEIPREWLPFYRRWLSRLREVGTRELRWADNLPSWSDRPEFTRVIDPTLALSRRDWEEIAQTSPVDGGLLLYELGDLQAAERIVVDGIAAAHDLQIHHLSEAVQGPLWETNAADFVAMVASVDCVVTDSYHGAIFAFIFDKPLVILRRHGFAGAMNSRIETLVNTLHLSDRLIDHVDVRSALQHDYSVGRNSLETHQTDFWAYLSRHGLTRRVRPAEGVGAQ